MCTTLYKVKDDYYTVKILIEEWGFPKKLLYEALRDGLIPFKRGKGGRILVPFDFVEILLFHDNYKEIGKNATTARKATNSTKRKHGRKKHHRRRTHAGRV